MEISPFGRNDCNFIRRKGGIIRGGGAADTTNNPFSNPAFIGHSDAKRGICKFKIHQWVRLILKGGALIATDVPIARDMTDWF